METSEYLLSRDAMEQDDAMYSEELIMGEGMEILNEVGDSEEENNEKEVNGDYQDEDYEETAANEEDEIDEDNAEESGDNISDAEDTAVQSAPFKFVLNWEMDDDPEIVCPPKTECYTPNGKYIGMKTLLVQNLPLITSKEDLRQFFMEFGPVASIKPRTFDGKPFEAFHEIRNDPSISAYITFKDTKSPSDAFKCLGHRTTFQGNVILLKKVRSGRVFANKSVVVTNLSPDTTKGDLQSHFRRFGEIMSLRLKKGVAYIAWGKNKTKKLARKRLHQSELNGYKINVYEMRPGFDRGKKPVPVSYNPNKMRWVNPNLRNASATYMEDRTGARSGHNSFQVHQKGDERGFGGTVGKPHLGQERKMMRGTISNGMEREGTSFGESTVQIIGNRQSRLRRLEQRKKNFINKIISKRKSKKRKTQKQRV